MITLKMCLNYLENQRIRTYGLKWNNKQDYLSKIILTDEQKRFLKNLCEGKLTRTPRCFGKSFVIRLYAECLDYYTDQCAHSGEYEDSITLKEMLESNQQIFKQDMISKEFLIKQYRDSPQNMLKQYNCDEAYAPKRCHAETIKSYLESAIK